MYRREFCGPREVVIRCEVNHPTFGFTRNLNDEPHVCSKCCHEISEDHVPLMIFGNGDDAWVYCEGCEVFVFRMVALRKRRP